MEVTDELTAWIRSLPRLSRISSASVTPVCVSAMHFNQWSILVRMVAIAIIANLTLACSPAPGPTRPLPAGADAVVGPESVDDLLVVDCLLPGQIRKTGLRMVTVGPRRPVKTTALDCGIRGGEYVAYDRANYKTARKVWLSDAEKGDKKAQNYLGEIYERGLGIAPDYKTAANWYQRAADQGYAPAQINLGNLYENGLGVSQDMDIALSWYRKAFGLADLKPRSDDLQSVSVSSSASEPPPGAAAVKTLEIETKPGSGPAIELIEPIVPPTRGIVLIPAEHDISERVIVGRVLAPDGLLALTVNGEDTSVETNGMFRTSVPVNESGSKVSIVAIDRTGQRAVREFRIKPAVPAPRAADFGNYHALVIGNNDYRILKPLKTARSDAEVIAGILRSKYGFKVTTLYDAHRYQILDTLNQLRKTLNEDDNLLIYYAGHGDLDEVNDRGHWLPIDAEPDSTANWISNVALTDILNIMSARHIMVVADSCYSGTLTRSVLSQLRAGKTEEARATYHRTVLKKRSRHALTSGGLAPVLDSGGGGHSVFAAAFIDSLRSSEESVLEGQQLFLEVAARVTHAADERRFEQIPQYAPIKYTGHEAGDFFFVPAAARASEPPALVASTSQVASEYGRLPVW